MTSNDFQVRVLTSKGDNSPLEHGSRRAKQKDSCLAKNRKLTDIVDPVAHDNAFWKRFPLQRRTEPHSLPVAVRYKRIVQKKPEPGSILTDVDRVDIDITEPPLLPGVERFPQEGGEPVAGQHTYLYTQNVHALKTNRTYRRMLAWNEKVFRR